MTDRYFLYIYKIQTKINQIQRNMKYFNDDFKEKLYETIEDIENHSLVETVAVIKSHTAKYRDVSLWFAFAFMTLLFTFFMFSPFEFNVYLIYFFSVLSFPFAYLFMELLPPLKRLFIRSSRLQRQSEIMARAVFQKGGIRFTEEKIGVLFFVALFERSIYIIPDRGAETLVPQEDWDKMKPDFHSIFSADNPADAFLTELQKTKNIFAENIPPFIDDINELPDDLDVEF
mgnify:CR=1 FL=1